MQEHCGEGILDEACLLELGWYTREVVVSYLTCKRCEKQECYIEQNKGQGVISRRQLEKLKWYGYVKKEERKAVCPKEGKVQ